MKAGLSSVITSLGLILALSYTSITAQSLSNIDNQNIKSAPAGVLLPNSVYSFDPVADATIRQDSPDNNFGSLTAIHTDNYPEKDFLIKFDITGVNNRQVLNATLRLYNEDSSSVGGDFHFVPDSNWDEGTVTWNNAPAQNPFIYASLGSVAAGNWYEVDLTSRIKADGIYSVRVTTTTSNGADYTSREGINPPQLILTVSNDATPTASLTPINSPTSTLTPTPSNTPTITLTPSQTLTPAPSATPLPNEYVRFAVIGDYGNGSQREQDVVTLVKSWNPDFIVTAGDNNYPDGGAATIDDHIGQFYHEYIYPYSGSFGSGANVNRFFPSLGNHDWSTGSIQAYLDYFVLPNNERYYDFEWGILHFFILDSDPLEPDGITATSVQANWLQAQLQNSNSSWNIVVLHHSPYSSGFEHGSQPDLQWPFKEWGADVVLSAHDHSYERLLVNEFPYIVNGLGGATNYPFNTPVPGSQVRYSEDYGALLGEANSTQLTFKFYSRSSVLIDTYTLKIIASPTSTATYTPSTTPTQTASNTPTATYTPTNTSTPTDTSTPTQTSSFTPNATSTFTATSSSTPTQTPSNTPTETYTLTNTFTPTQTPSSTPSATSTFTATSSSTLTQTPSNTSTATYTPTNTSIPTQTSSSTPSMTSTFTATPSCTPTWTPSNTPTTTYSPTSTSTQTPTYTPTDTSTPTQTPSHTPTATFTPTATPSSTVTFTPVPPSPTSTPSEEIYLSSTTSGTVGDVAFDDEDILKFDSATGTWSLYFDGSDVGLGVSNGSEVDAFRLMSDGSILFSLVRSSTISNVGSVDDSDVIRFVSVSLGVNTAGTFEWYFDGSDVGLSTSSEDVDVIGLAPDGRLLISTIGSFSVTGVSGNDEDLIAFAPSSLGSNTSGTWTLYFDGSDVGLSSSSEDINGASFDPVTGQIFLTTTGNFSVNGLSGTGADIFVCTPGSLGSNTTCTFEPYWIASEYAFDGEIADGIVIIK